MKFPRYKKGERAFTLYTALLSFILILLAGLLVTTMINAERVSNQVVLEVEAQSRMQSLADLTRADSLQVVNYGIRNAIEEYVQQPGNAYPYSQQVTSWSQVKTDFSNFFFGKETGETISGRIASNLYVLIQSQPKRVGGYVISIEGGNTPQLQAAIQSVLVKTAGGTNADFLQVVGCEEETDPIHCVGTFYVNLDFSLIDDETYEKLPSIHVFDESTERELVEPVIPRGKFRIYVPLRMFRALKYAQVLANGPLQQGGLLSPEFTQNLEKLGVGMCDDVDTTGVVNCGIRTQPFTLANPSSLGPSAGAFLCPADPTPPVIENYIPTNIALTADALTAQFTNYPAGQTITQYDPADAVSRKDALNKIVTDAIGGAIGNLLDLPALDESEDFKLLTQQVTVEPQIISYDSKNIQFEGIDVSTTNAVAKCTRLATTDVTLKFEETNEQYIVVDTRKPLIYQVRIVDSYNVNPSQGTCVSYCLAQSGTDIFINPELGGVCAQTACAPSNTYEPPAPPCGNGVVNTELGEDCDPASSTTSQACTAIDPAAYSDGTATCSPSCQWDVSACVAVTPPPPPGP